MSRSHPAVTGSDSPLSESSRNPAPDGPPEPVDEEFPFATDQVIGAFGMWSAYR